MNSCGTCKHLLRETESWEMSHIWWWTCLAAESRANLKSFPFKNTRCALHEARKAPLGATPGVLSRIKWLNIEADK